MRRPKILLVQTQAESGGAQEIARLLAAGLAAKGYDTGQAFFFRRTRSFDDAANTGFCANERPAGPLDLARLLARYVILLRRTRPDVVMTFQHYGNIIGAPLARIAGVRHVIANQTTTLGALHPAVRRTDRILGQVGVYDRVVINSETTGSDHARHPRAYRDRIVHIPHGFERKTSRLTKLAARQALALSPEVVLLGGVGRLHPSKNWEAAIRLLPARPAWHLAIAGQGADGVRLAILAETLGCSDRVRFLGELPPCDIGTFLAALDGFVFPTLAETFGLAAVEAVQAGVPVVANRLSVLEEVLCIDGEPCALFADANDPDALVAAVDRLLADHALADALTTRGERLDVIYSLQAMVDAYAALIEQTIASKSRARGTTG